MKRLTVTLCCLMCALLFVSFAQAEQPAPSVTGKLKVTGAQLTDANGDPVQLKGLSTHGIAWFPQYVNREFFHELRDSFGCSAVRLAMYTYENGGYCTDGDREALKQRVLDGVQYAKEADLYVIVDWHILYDLDPNVYAEEAIAFFDEMSRTLKDETHVLYEICNEPNGGTTWQQIRHYAEAVIPVIRANDPDAIVLVGTPSWSQQILDAANDPLPFDNVMYTLHYYAATHGEWLRDNMVKAIKKGLPVFVTEYGVCSADGNGRYDFAQSGLWADLLDEYKVSSMMWSIANSNELCALFRTDCTKVSGFTAQDLTDGGLWLVNRLGGKLLQGQESAVPTAQPLIVSDNLCMSGSFGSWIDKESGADAKVVWSGNSCTAGVLSSGDRQWLVQPSCSNLKLVQGQTYEVTFSLSATESILYDVCLQKNYGDYAAYASLMDIEATPQAKTYTMVCTMNAETDANVSLVFNIGGNGVKAYDVRIEDVCMVTK